MKKLLLKLLWLNLLVLGLAVSSYASAPSNSYIYTKEYSPPYGEKVKTIRGEYKISCSDNTKNCLGFITYCITKNEAQIDKLFVAGGSRKHGIGSELLRQACKDMRNKIDIDITVRAEPIFDKSLTEQELIAFYERNGAVRMHKDYPVMKFPALKPKPTYGQKHKNIIVKSISAGAIGLTAFAAYKWLYGKRD